MITIRRNQTFLAEAAQKAVAKKRAAYVAEVNATIDQVRVQFITPITGQDIIYLRKEKEARAYVAEDPEPELLDSYPFLQREVGITAPTAYQLAQIWLFMAQQLPVIGSASEALRLSAYAALEAATSDEEFDSAMNAFRAGVSAL
jgi:hypothetical protein